MEKLRRILASALVLALCLVCAVPACAATKQTSGSPAKQKCECDKEAAAKAKVVCTRGTFTSTSKTPTQIVYFTWQDSTRKPKGIVQLTHGYAEHIQRYDDLARYLASNGYVVVGQDHLGHGLTGKEANSFGITPDDGAEAMINDMHKLMRITKAKYPGLPYIVYGHSMGSYMTRAFCSRWSDEIDGTIWAGSCFIPSEAYLLSPAMDVYAQIAGKDKIDTRTAELQAKYPVLQTANLGIILPDTASDWLSYDSRNVQKFIADPLNAKAVAPSLSRDSVKLIMEGSKRGYLDTIRNDLPIFIMSGKADSCGVFGVGTTLLEKQAQQSGKKNIRLKLYDGRHEIHNDFCKDQVYADMLDFCNSVVAQQAN